jgi:hypothetical protein
VESAEPEEIDPATLPPLESLGPDSDFTVFLKKGVPEALRIAALRKAWALDPFIRDFRSPAIDYGWDFTTPEFNLRPTDDVAKLLDRIFPANPEAPAAEPQEAVPANAKAGPSEPTPPALPLPQKEAAQSGPSKRSTQSESAPALRRRRHGGALPD